MILGIDFGITTTDVALMHKCKLLRAFCIKSKSLGELKKSLSKQGVDLGKVESIAVTGGMRTLKRISGKRVVHINELDAIGFGGAFVSKLRDALIVSMGTGTCMVSFKNGKAKHAAGTALGGGTIIGLSHMLLHESNIEKLQRLASKGSLQSVDLSVKEAIGSGIGIVPGSAAASNFAKKGKASKADIALAIQNMVAESNAVIAALAAKGNGHRKIVFVGKTPQFNAVKKTLKRVLSYYGFKPIFPPAAGHAMAIGAALAQQNCFK